MPIKTIPTILSKPLLAGAPLLAAGMPMFAQSFDPNELVVSRSVYTGTASTVTIGQALPGGGTAVADGSYPNVWQNEGPDPSFGITSPIYLDQVSTSGTRLGSTNVSSELAGQ